MHCLDLLTGQTALAAAGRKDRLYLACVHEGHAVFVGTQPGLGDPAGRRPAGLEQAIPLTDPPSGRGFYSDQFYFLPTAGRNC